MLPSLRRNHLKPRKFCERDSSGNPFWSFSDQKDWEWIARPTATRNFLIYRKYSGGGLAQIKKPELLIESIRVLQIFRSSDLVDKNFFGNRFIIRSQLQEVETTWQILDCVGIIYR